MECDRDKEFVYRCEKSQSNCLSAIISVYILSKGL